MFDRYSDRARQVIVLALWSARDRGGTSIEPEDLLQALIREDRGEFDAFTPEIFPGTPAGIADRSGARRSFFTSEAAASLLADLHTDPEPHAPTAPPAKPEPAPAVDLPVSASLKHVLELAAQSGQNDASTIEPLHLLAAIAEDRESSTAQLLRAHGITRQKIAEAIHPSGGSAAL